jgi:YfiH family protein
MEEIFLSYESGRDYVEIPSPARGFRTVLSLKSSGDMRWSQGNRWKKFLLGMGIDPSRAVSLKQVHSRRVFVVGNQNNGGEGDLPWPLPQQNLTEGDGLITAAQEAVLCVKVADCMPIYLFDRKNGAFGLLHSGWKGTGIVSDAVRLMKARFGSNPSNLAVILGPCIGPCCYYIEEERYRLFKEHFGEKAVRSFRGQYALDLHMANITILEGLGIDSITSVRNCSSCDSRLSSYRRDGADDFAGMLAVSGYF